MKRKCRRAVIVARRHSFCGHFPFRKNLPSIHHHHGAGWALTMELAGRLPWSWLGAYHFVAIFPFEKISPRSTITMELAGRLPWSWLGAYRGRAECASECESRRDLPTSMTRDTVKSLVLRRSPRKQGIPEQLSCVIWLAGHLHANSARLRFFNPRHRIGRNSSGGASPSTTCKISSGVSANAAGIARSNLSECDRANSSRRAISSRCTA